jgi:hypothetical protein
MRFVAAVFSAAVLLSLPAGAAAQAAATPATAPQTPAAGSQTPPAAPSTTPATAAPGTPAAAAAPVTRTFTAPVGLLFNTVRTERVADFEKVLGYLKAALQKSSDPDVQAQARGWRIFKATEPGPNTTVLYVFEFDPTVPNADYGLGRILADAYPDPALLQEIWRLYTTSVTSGGSLLNLTPVEPPDPSLTAPGTPAAVPPATSAPLPPNSNPVQRP